MTNKKIGIGICGSFCTFSKILPIIRDLAQDNQVTAVLSHAAQSTDKGLLFLIQKLLLI